MRIGPCNKHQSIHWVHCFQSYFFSWWSTLRLYFIYIYICCWSFFWNGKIDYMPWIIDVNNGLHLRRTNDKINCRLRVSFDHKRIIFVDELPQLCSHWGPRWHPWSFGSCCGGDRSVCPLAPAWTNKAPTMKAIYRIKPYAQKLHWCKSQSKKMKRKIPILDDWYVTRRDEGSN